MDDASKLVTSESVFACILMYQINYVVVVVVNDVVLVSNLVNHCVGVV